jgi:hypothetical protein
LTFDDSVSRLINQVAHWSPARWSKPVAAGDVSRADAFHALVQQLADAGADASGEPRRPVPRLDNALALPDQLRVVAADLGPAATQSLDDAVRATAASL